MHLNFENEGISTVISVALMVAITIAIVSMVTITVFNITDDMITDRESSNAVVKMSSTNGTVTVQLIKSGSTANSYEVESINGTYTISQVGDSVTVDSYGGDVDVISDSGDSEKLIDKYDASEASDTTTVRVVSQTTASNTFKYSDINSADSEALPGDTILVKSGTYSDSDTVNGTIETDNVNVIFEDGVEFDCALAGKNIGLRIKGSGVTVNGGLLGEYFNSCNNSMLIDSDNVTLNGVTTRQNLDLDGQYLVVNDGNTDPISNLSVDFSGTINTQDSVTLNASNSSDVDDSIVSYDWDTNNDGLYEEDGQTTTVSYSNDGSYTVVLKVTDEFGQTDKDQMTITVANQDPTVVTNSTSKTGTTADTLDFNASNSSDPDGRIDSYEWDLGDGTTKTGRNISYSYDSAGSYTVTLTATDDDGGTSTSSVSLTVQKEYFILSDATYTDNSYNTGGETNTPNSIEFNDDGSMMYIIENDYTRLYQYDLSTPYNMTTVQEIDRFNDIIELSENFAIPEDIEFNNDGTKLFVVGERSEDIYAYNLSTPYDITTAKFTDNNLYHNQDNNPRGIEFSDDGTKLFVADEGHGSDNVYQYNLGTSFDVTTGSYSGKSLNVSSEDYIPTDMEVNKEGTRVYLSGQDNSVYKYSMGSSNDISTASYTGDKLNIDFNNLDLDGLTFNSDLSKMFVVDVDSDNVYSYTE